jgi:L-rhamnose isomerase/sugar isomerase
MREIATGPGVETVAFMIDQSHNVEGKIDAMIQSVMNIQSAYAKALLVDGPKLAAAQREGDVLGAHRIFLDAFETDVRPLLGRLRESLGVDPDPVEAFRRGGYAERLAAERGTASVESAYERA